MLTNKDLFFASIMGVDNIAIYQRAKMVQNELSKLVLPPIPFLPLTDNVTVAQYKQESLTENRYSWETDKPLTEDQQYFPLSFSFCEGGQKWLFPYEPMINISSGNNIIKRNVAKQGDKLVGTIKERWSRKDFDIQVTGALIGNIMTGKVADCYPKEQLRQLFDYLKYNKEFFVYSEPLFEMGITKVVVEDYSFPFTKGENVQAYDIKLVSDFAYNLLVKE